HAILDDQQDLGRIQGLMLRHAVDQLVDDARVGAGVVARASPAVAHATGMPAGVGILRPAASVPALRVPALVLAVAALVEVGVGELVGEVAPPALAFVTERVVLARRRTPAAVGRRWHVAVLALARVEILVAARAARVASVHRGTPQTGSSNARPGLVSAAAMMRLPAAPRPQAQRYPAACSSNNSA